MRSIRKTVTVVLGVAASLAFVVPTAQAGEVETLHYTCGQTRPPNLDGSAIVTAGNSAGVRRGSSEGCGLNGTIMSGDRLDYYCYTLGNDGRTWTFLSDLSRGIAGWSVDSSLPNNGSSRHCPI